MRNLLRRFFNRFRKPVGLPLGQHVPADIEEHARDFATRYWEPLKAIALKRMREVGVPKEEARRLLQAQKEWSL